MNAHRHNSSQRAGLDDTVDRTSPRPEDSASAAHARPPARSRVPRRPWRLRLRRSVHGRHTLATPTAEAATAHRDSANGAGNSARTTTEAPPAFAPTSGAEAQQATARSATARTGTAAVRTTATGAGAWARAGWNTGSVPYGYRARRVLVTPANGRPRYRSRLVIEPVEAATVRQIFLWRSIDQLATAEILQRLTAARYPQPLHPATGQPRPWTLKLIRSLLANPKYLGRQAWGRTRHGRPRPPRDWTWSPANPYLALITHETFLAAQTTRSRIGDGVPADHRQADHTANGDAPHPQSTAATAVQSEAPYAQEAHR